MASHPIPPGSAPVLLFHMTRSLLSCVHVLVIVWFSLDANSLVCSCTDVRSFSLGKTIVRCTVITFYSLFSHRAMPVLALTPEFSYSRSSFVFHLLQHAYACFHSSLPWTNSRALLFFFFFKAHLFSEKAINSYDSAIRS